jgi:hypothetical protein
MQLATRALAITRAESAANKAAALKTSSSNASLKASASAASPASRARAEVETFDDEPGPRGASNEGDVGGVSARDEHALIRDLAAATGLHHEQIVVLGSIGSSDSASVCLALLHMSVGALLCIRCLDVRRRFARGALASGGVVSHLVDPKGAVERAVLLSLLMAML